MTVDLAIHFGGVFTQVHTNHIRFASRCGASRASAVDICVTTSSTLESARLGHRKD